MIASAQDTIEVTSLADSVHTIESHAAYFVDTSNTFSLQQLTNAPFKKTIDPRKVILARFRGREVTAWLRWHVGNATSRPLNLVWVFHRMSFFRMYSHSSNGMQSMKVLPSFYTSQIKNERRSANLRVPPGETVTVYIQMRDPGRNLFPGYPIVGYPSQWKAVSDIHLRQLKSQLFLDIFVIGIVFFITIHTFAQYYFNRRKEFLLYAFYCTSVLAFALFKLEEYSFVDIFFSHFPYVHNYGNDVVSYILYLGYYRFVRNFIDFKAIAKWFYRVILITEALLIAAIIADVLLVLAHQFQAKALVFNLIRCYLLVTGFTGIILLFTSKNKQAYFIAVGSGCLLAGGLLSMILSWTMKRPYSGFDPLIYMQVGIVVELLCFTLGLSYKTSLIEKDKIEAQRQLIVQLKENKKLQEELTTRLEARVQQQMIEIVAQQHQLEKEREQQITLEFKKKLTEMELKVLKSQLNPHFYFNTLNNLYGLTITDPKKAPDAILKLSDIMEYVIYDCKSEKVPVAKELKFISSYVELEKLRYEDSSRIQLRMQGSMEEKFISPLLLIQFIENAFKHGMEQNKNESYLFVDIAIKNNHLLYHSVNSMKEKARNLNGVGLSSVQKRLEMLYPDQHTLFIREAKGKFEVELDLELS